jgi:hypothetical protein
MHADGTEHRTKDRSGTTVPMLPVLDLPGALLDVGCAIVVRLHLLDEGIELALDPAEAAQDVVTLRTTLAGGRTLSRSTTLTMSRRGKRKAA